MVSLKKLCRIRTVKAIKQAHLAALDQAAANLDASQAVLAQELAAMQVRTHWQGFNLWHTRPRLQCQLCASVTWGGLCRLCHGELSISKVYWEAAQRTMITHPLWHHAMQGYVHVGGVVGERRSKLRAALVQSVQDEGVRKQVGCGPRPLFAWLAVARGPRVMQRPASSLRSARCVA